MEKVEALAQVGNYLGTSLLQERPSFILANGDVTDGGITITSSGIQSACAELGIPARFLMEKCSPDLQERVLAELAETKPIYPVMKNDEVTAFMSDVGYFVDTERMFDVLDNAIPSADFNRVYTHPRDGIGIAISGERQTAVRKGDLVGSGALVKFHPFGSAGVEVQTYVNRLVCTNGMVSTESRSKYRRPASEGYGSDLYDWVRERTIFAYDQAAAEVERLRASVDIILTDSNREGIMRHALDRLPSSTRGAVQDLLITNPPDTLYDMINILTDVASHQVERIGTAEELMLLANNTIDHTRTCEECHQVVN